MNNAPEQPRMSSLDRRIEVARLRAERERAAAHPQPTQGLTSTMSTESCDIAQPRNKQPLLVIYHEPPIVHAMAVLRQAMQEDPDYARGWHDNIAMAFKDSWAQQAAEECRKLSTGTRNLVHKQANRAAAHFMHLCFGADTSKHAPEGTVAAAMDAVRDATQKDPDWIAWQAMRLPVDKKGAASSADPVHTIIQQEAAAPHPWARFLPGQQASQQAQLAAGDNTLRGLGNGWINGAPRTK